MKFVTGKEKMWVAGLVSILASFAINGSIDEDLINTFGDLSGEIVLSIMFSLLTAVGVYVVPNTKEEEKPVEPVKPDVVVVTQEQVEAREFPVVNLD